MTYLRINPEQPIPDNYRLLWDFSFLVDNQPVGQLWRQKDKKSVLVVASYDVQILSDLDVLFPDEKPEVPAPAPEHD